MTDRNTWHSIFITKEHTLRTLSDTVYPEGSSQTQSETVSLRFQCAAVPSSWDTCNTGRWLSRSSCYLMTDCPCCRQ